MALTKVSMELLEGVTSTAAELNLLDDVSGLVQADLTKLAAIDATAAELNYLDIATLGLTEASRAVTADANGVVTYAGATSDKVTALSSGATQTLNLRDGGIFTHTLTDNVTYTFSNPAGAGYGSSFVVKIQQHASAAKTITWPATVDWAGGSSSAPVMSTGVNNVDVYVFFIVDSSTPIYLGFMAGQVIS